MSFRFRALTAPGAAALQLWLLEGDPVSLQGVLGKNAPIDVQPRLHRLQSVDGSVLDEVVVRSPRPGKIELSLHGGLGVTRALRARFVECGGVEEVPRRDAIVNARSPLAARFAWADAQRAELDLNARAAAHGGWAAWAEALLPQRAWAELARGDAKMVLAGQPNAGKSSLMNAWLREQRVTVSPHPGTTRDAVEATIVWGDGVDAAELQLVDTAGLWADATGTDARAVARSHEVIAEAWRVLWVHDASCAPGPELAAGGLAKAEHLLLLSHADQPLHSEVEAALRAFPGVFVGSYSLIEQASEAVAACSEALRQQLGPAPAPGADFPLSPSAWTELEAAIAARD